MPCVPAHFFIPGDGLTCLRVLQFLLSNHRVQSSSECGPDSGTWRKPVHENPRQVLTDLQLPPGSLEGRSWGPGRVGHYAVRPWQCCGGGLRCLPARAALVGPPDELAPAHSFSSRGIPSQDHPPKLFLNSYPQNLR